MSCYRLIRYPLFCLPPEMAHQLAIAALRWGVLSKIEIETYPMLQQNIWGISFSNPVGLAAGFDKNAQVMRALSQQGFGFIEVGTVTPKPQSGNTKPRLFRLTPDKAVINRMGFNNEGVEAFVSRLRHRPPGVVIGANIGKNKTTEQALDDYTLMLQQVYGLSDYIVINISSPNTPGLRALQEPEALRILLESLVQTKHTLMHTHQKNIPLLLKIDPDGTTQQRQEMAEIIKGCGIDGLIVSNTTVQRPSGLIDPAHNEVGGLSGEPLRALSTQAIKEMYQYTDGKIPIIGVGGIASGEDAYAKIKAGASLIQLYSALVYEGFGLVSRIVRELEDLLIRDGFSHLREAVGVEAAI